MKYEITYLENYAIILDPRNITPGDWISDEYHLWVWEDNSSLLGRKKVIAHLPLNDFPILEGVPLLPDPNNEANIVSRNWFATEILSSSHIADIKSFEQGFEKAKEKYKYTEEDMIKCWKAASIDKHQIFGDQIGENYPSFIQSLISNRKPKFFQPSVEDFYDQIEGLDIRYFRRKTNTNEAGIIEWVGEYYES